MEAIQGINSLSLVLVLLSIFFLLFIRTVYLAKMGWCCFGECFYDKMTVRSTLKREATGYLYEGMEWNRCVQPGSFSFAFFGYYFLFFSLFFILSILTISQIACVSSAMMFFYLSKNMSQDTHVFLGVYENFTPTTCK